MEDKDLEQRLNEALQKMEEIGQGSELVIFTAPQAQALMQVAEWWIAVRGAGKLGAALGSAIKWLAFFIGAWVAIKAGILDWIISNTGGQQ